MERSDQTTPPENDSEVSEEEQAVRWQMTDSGWMAAGGTPPKCPDPILKLSPIDTAKATSLLIPGQYRGAHFKAHGGYRFDNASSNAVTVKLPFDAQLTDLTRYYQIGMHSGQQELQYLLTFVHPCGIMVRFDHLATLSEDLEKIAATRPEPKLDDTRSLPLSDQPSFKAGATVATHIGAPNGSNTGLDIGVYDLRQKNEVSKNQTWAALHSNEASQTFYAVCWIDWLPKADAQRTKTLLSQAPASHKGASDYCAGAPGGTTLQHNNGQPVQ